MYGDGEVLALRRQGTEALVHFDTGLELWVPVQRLRFMPVATRPISQLRAERMIEAFRLGIVPLRDVEEFTFGRVEELKKAREALESLRQGQGGALLIEGEYGTGKTHLLEYIHHEALRMGAVVSRLEFDPCEVTPSRPKRVYRELVHNLRWLADSNLLTTRSRDAEDSEQPSSSSQSGTPDVLAKSRQVECGFRELLEEAAGLDMSDHVYFAPLLRKLRQTQRRLSKVGSRGTGVRADPLPSLQQLKTEVFWQMVEGESTKSYAVDSPGPYRLSGGQGIPALYDFSTACDFYCYVLTGLSYICHELGLHGLVVIIDEAETITHLWDIIAFTRGVSFLEGLIRSAQNDPELKAIDSRLVHNRVRPTPYIYREAHLLLVLAATPELGNYQYLKMTYNTRNRISLPRLRSQDLLDAFDRLIELYQSAYPDFRPSAVDLLQLRNYAYSRRDQGIRFIVKLCVEAMDLLRLRRQGLDFRQVRV